MLTKEASKHLSQVLRKKEGTHIQLFDGEGFSCVAEITAFKKNLFSDTLNNELYFNIKKMNSIKLS